MAWVRRLPYPNLSSHITVLQEGHRTWSIPAHTPVLVSAPPSTKTYKMSHRHILLMTIKTEDKSFEHLGKTNFFKTVFLMWRFHYRRTCIQTLWSSSLDHWTFVNITSSLELQVDAEVGKSTQNWTLSNGFVLLQVMTSFMLQQLQVVTEQKSHTGTVMAFRNQEPQKLNIAVEAGDVKRLMWVFNYLPHVVTLPAVSTRGNLPSLTCKDVLSCLH